MSGERCLVDPSEDPTVGPVPRDAEALAAPRKRTGRKTRSPVPSPAKVKTRRHPGREFLLRSRSFVFLQTRRWETMSSLAIRPARDSVHFIRDTINCEAENGPSHIRGASKITTYKGIDVSMKVYGIFTLRSLREEFSRRRGISGCYLGFCETNCEQYYLCK